jgi:hypothetical protein
VLASGSSRNETARIDVGLRVSAYSRACSVEAVHGWVSEDLQQASALEGLRNDHREEVVPVELPAPLPEMSA